MEEAQPVNGSSLSHIQLTQWPLRCGARRMLTELLSYQRVHRRNARDVNDGDLGTQATKILQERWSCHCRLRSLPPCWATGAEGGGHYGVAVQGTRSKVMDWALPISDFALLIGPTLHGGQFRSGAGSSVSRREVLS